MANLAKMVLAMLISTAFEAHSSQPIDAQLPLLKIVVNGKTMDTIAPLDRIRLSKDAAIASNLKAHGLDWKDLYAIVNAESDWSPRDGMGRNGRVSRGLAQLEDSTARSLGVDPHDTKQALGAVASLLKDAADWSKAKGHAVSGGSLSVYYNLSTVARNQWDGEVVSLPIETQRHIHNVRQSRLSAAQIDRAWTIEQNRLAKQMAGIISKSDNRPTPVILSGTRKILCPVSNSA